MCHDYCIIIMQSSCICATQSSSFSFAPSFFLCSFHFPASAVLRYMLWRSHVVVLSVAWKCSPMLLQGETVWRSCSERFAGVAADCAPVAHLLLPNKHTHTHTHTKSRCNNMKLRSHVHFGLCRSPGGYHGNVFFYLFFLTYPNILLPIIMYH